MKPWRIIISVVIGVILGFVIREILFSVLVDDICVYHNGLEPGFFIANFYDMPGWNGFHPAPNLLNNILVILIGGGFGFAVYFMIGKLDRKRNEQHRF